MKLVFISFVVLSVLVVGYFFVVPAHQRFAFLMNSHERHFYNTFRSKIEAGQSTVGLSELVPQKWDTVCVLSPYSIGADAPKEKLQEYITADISLLDANSVRVSDDTAWAFVFISNEKVVAIVKTYGGYSYSLDQAQKSPGQNCARDAAFVFTPPSNITIKLGGNP